MTNFTPALLLLLSFTCMAQTAAPAFEVASVRLSEGGGFGNPVRTSPDSLTIHGFSLQNCIQMAYQLPQARVIGPLWMNDVRLDIVAKAAGPVDEQQLFLMLRKLLADRMGVKARLENQQTPVYALTLAKDGPKFSESTTTGPPVIGKDKSGPNMQRVSMSEFAIALSQGFGRPFVDSTGLKGRYDIRVNMTPYLAEMTADGATPLDSIGIVMTVLQKELGLKVESRKDNMEMLIVEHAEKIPTEN
jgi:uncharacterized protein (TIGR03435 family)